MRKSPRQRQRIFQQDIIFKFIQAINQVCDKIKKKSLHTHGSYGRNFPESANRLLIRGGNFIKGSRIILHGRLNTYKNHGSRYGYKHGGDR